MCLKDLEGTFYLKNGLPYLILDEKTTAEHLDEILGLYEEKNPEAEDKIDLRIVHNPHGLTLKSPLNDLKTVVLDLREEGANIRIAPSISFRGFLQDPPFERKHALTDREFGQLLARCPELAT